MSDPIKVDNEVFELLKPNPSRRQLLARAGIVGAAALGTGMLGFGKGNQAEAVLTAKFGGAKGKKYTLVDFDILNFALNLEYLEAEFYQIAAFGRRLPDSMIGGVGTVGTVTGGSQVDFAGNDVIQQYAEEIATDELNHVELLRSVLGKKAVARPSLSLDTAFAVAAQGAGVTTDASFSPYDSAADFLLGAFVFEDVGVTAYHGAAPYVHKPDYVIAATGILAVEAYHAAEIRTLLVQMGQTTPALITAANLISAFRGAASAGADATATNGDEGITVVINGVTLANIVPTDANSVAFSRTFAEVLNIVYLGGAANAYGFFPNKLNGKIA